MADAGNCDNYREEISRSGSDSIDVLSNLPRDFYSKLDTSKWQDRKESLDALLALLQQPKFEPGNYSDVVRALKKVLSNDSNVTLVALAGQCIALLAKGLRKSFAPFAVSCVSRILDKFKEKKANVVLALREAIDAIYPSTSLDALQSYLLDALKNKNPSVKAETAAFLARAFAQTNPGALNKKVVKAFSNALLKTLNESDCSVRDRSAEALGTLYKLVDENMLPPFLAGVEPVKMSKIKECSMKAVILWPGIDVGTFRISKRPASAITKSDTENRQPAKQPKLCDEPASVMPTRHDISTQITEALLAELNDSNWKTRNDGLSKLQGILDDAKLIEPSIGDLPQVLALRLVDSNAKIAQIALEVCKQLAESMGPACKQHVRTLFPGMLNDLGDIKGCIRAASVACINAWGDQCGYKEFFDGEMIATALSNGTPAFKTELWTWLTEKLPQLPPKSIRKNEIVAILPFLYANLCDRNPDVRKNANGAVMGCMLHVGYNSMVKEMEMEKPTAKMAIQEMLDKARHNLPVKPLPNASKGAVAAAKGAISRKKEELVDPSPLLPLNNLKHQRMLDDRNAKKRKWSFSTPRDEIVKMLRDQMTVAGFNKNLLVDMFHEDFRYHLKAIESLRDDLPANLKSLICNLDLILKWILLCFYDTHPSVQHLALSYLELVWQALALEGNECTESECGCFLPHLLNKLGDPKDSVRNGVRSIFRKIGLTYPASKMFTCFMDGLKSKNARQRAECLSELTHLMDAHGLSAFQPTPRCALNEITRHISDRDHSVRKAAFNFLAHADHLFEGGIYTLIGKLSIKDQKVLDEYIKRSRDMLDGAKVVDAKIEEIADEQEPEGQAVVGPS